MSTEAIDYRKRRFLQCALGGGISLSLAALTKYLPVSVFAQETGQSEDAIQVLGSPDAPWVYEQVDELIHQLVAEHLPGDEIEGNALQVTYAVYPEPYRMLPETFGYDSFEEFISYHVEGMSDMFKRSGLRDPMTNEPFGINLRRIMILDAESSTRIPASANYGYMYMNIPDSYGTAGNPEILPSYVSPDQTDYEVLDENGILVDRALQHELAHQFLTLPDLYPQSFDGTNDPTLAGVPSIWRVFYPDEGYRREGSGLMSGAGSIAEPYLVWLLMNRLYSGNLITDYDRYLELLQYRTNVARGDTLHIQVLNEHLPSDIASVEVLRTTPLSEAQTANLPHPIGDMTREEEQVRMAEASTDRRLELVTHIPWNSSGSSEFAMPNPWEYKAQSDSPEMVWIGLQESVTVLLFKNADGQPTGIRYIPVTDITTGQHFELGKHNKNMRLGLHIAMFNEDTNRIHFDWSVQYPDGTHVRHQSDTTSPLFDPPTQATPTPTRTPVSTWTPTPSETYTPHPFETSEPTVTPVATATSTPIPGPGPRIKTNWTLHFPHISK
ncbi:hypothetical protein HY469_03395 [Candidatus Roizmanbacteria bacterium]|nr:hypothetical protein [Candidatus Roizmanbacteria bacterium]